jgi:hypothetical protein
MNWYQIYKQAMPKLRTTPDAKDVSHYRKTLEYFDKNIDQKTKERLDSERRRQYIDHGGYGIAYEAEDIHGHNPEGKLVEKLTREDYEYNNAQYLMANQGFDDDYPVARVYDAEVLKKGRDKNSGVNRIFLEYVEPVSPEFEKIWNAIDICSMNYQSLEENKNDIIKCAMFKAGLDVEPPKLLELSNTVFDQLVDLELRLAKYGFSPEDHHGANIGYRGNHLVILDLGAIARYE